MKNNSKKTNKQNTTRTRAQGSGRRVTRRSKDDRRRILFSKKRVKMETRRAIYGTDHGAAYALARGTDLNRRFVAAFLALVFAISTMVIGLNIVTSAEDPAPAASTKSAELESNLVLDKYITPQADGTYNLTLSAYAKGAIKNTTTQIPTDFIFVVDQSGSMAYNDMPLDYEATEKKDWTISEINASNTPYYYYDANTGDYHRVYTKWGPLYELVPRNSLYLQELIDRSSLSWFRDAGEQEQEFDSMYYYQPSYDPLINHEKNPDRDLADDSHFYPLTMSVQNAPLYYYMTFSYRDINNAPRTMKYYYNKDTKEAPIHQSGVTYVPSYEESNSIIYYNSVTGGGIFGPGQSFALSYENINRLVVYAAGEGSSPVSAIISSVFGGYPEEGFYYRYTYAQALGMNTGMYVQNPMFIGHSGYNQLCYRDSNGVEQYLIKTDYCNSNDVPLENPKATSELSWNGTLYTIKKENGSPKTETRLQALNTALKGFITSVADQAETYNADHRVAIVGFSSDADFNNNEILSGVTVEHGLPGSMGNTPGDTSEYSLDGKTHNGLQYSTSITQEQYYSSLVSVRTGEDNLKTEAVDSITAKGGTQPEIGFKMAEEIIKARNNSSDPTDKDRQTVVIFFTDGRPGNYSYVDQYQEANDVVSASKRVKDLGAKVYSVGVFNEADGNPLTYRSISKLYPMESIDNIRNRTCQSNAFLHNHVLGYGDLGDAYSVYAVRQELLKDGYELEQLSENGKYIQEYKTNYVKKEDGYTLSVNTGTWYWGNNNHYANNVYLTYYEKYFYYRNCLASTYGYPDQPNDTIADYMTTVSSTYPKATSFDGGWSTGTTSSNYETTMDQLRGTAVNQNYYLSCSNADKLEKEFINISSMETVPAIDTSASFDLKDVISTYFDNSHASVSIATQKGTEKQGTELADKYIEWGSVETLDLDGNVISYDWIGDEDNPKVLVVSGFNFAANYIALGKEANSDEGTSADQGKKLIVTISGLVPKDDVGTMPSNADGSGIIMHETGEGGTVESTEIDSFESPEITRRKYILNVGAAHTAGVFNVDYELSTQGTPKAQSIVTRNAKEGKRYSELTDGQFKAMAPGDNNTWTDTVGNGNTVYVEYITKQPSKDAAAPPVVDPTDYTLEATVTNANTAENKAKYKYYLSNDHYLQPSEQDDSANGNGLNSQTRTVSLGTSLDGNLYVSSKTNNRTVTIKETVSGTYADDTATFRPNVYLIPPTGTNVPTTATYGNTSWERDGNNDQLTTTVSAIRGNGEASATITVPVDWTLVVKQTNGNFYEVGSATFSVGTTTGTYPTYDASTGWSWNLTDNVEITIDNVKNDIPVTGLSDNSDNKTLVFLAVAIVMVFAGMAMLLLYQRKKSIVKHH